MKKILGIALSLIMVVMLLTACGKKEDVDEENHKTKTAKNDIITSENKTSNSSSDEIHNTTSTINGVKVNWEYTIRDGSNLIQELKCTNPQELVGDIKIPSTLDGKKVFSIGQHAFSGADRMTGATIPDSVYFIRGKAFASTGLKTIDLPVSLKELGDEAFVHCYSLEEVLIPDTCNCIIDQDAFYFCINLKKIVIPDSVDSIGYYTRYTAGSDIEKLEKKRLDSQGTADSVFYGCHPDLTIYCYENSIAAQYAARYNIKYEYLKK